MSRPSIYNYFEGKEEIFLALLTREYGKVDRRCQKADRNARFPGAG
ncbi:hypothetical protein lacNasYZ03_10860 [Lactobacillus nasalidis]|uniref:TetR family transcriptional regulator n=1 Tax=Lactobacillus nasalidis TaxID=2797258 RepID=A0ABQ3W6P6_9LACO|nr:TetR/AcrR family transcriptional regulator [Lactobacillus nasalidis]GHV97142.1 hypothetical protein lacNasYZ01_03240 [Lactobacillus nasalidis]GHV99129.1 hypothetical protein lacNasYZ02_05590 [Lactobacillus nasalidis]GHW01399.1 hypothetical protein lacNasYZ03_10860 [Lactobacillus nasalidis]